MYIKVNSTELYYEKTGRGRPIILLHGNGENHASYVIRSEKLYGIIEPFLTDVEEIFI